MNTEEHSKSQGGVILCSARFCAFAVMLAIVLAATWFVFSIVTDGINAKLIALDSYDPERTKVWETRYTNEAMRGWAIPGLVAFGVIFILIRGMVRSVRDAWRSK